MPVSARPFRPYRLRLEPLEDRLVLNTYFVAPDGDDGNSGGEFDPFLTLQEAADTVISSDIVIVRAGHYANFNLFTTGTEFEPILFHAEPGVFIDQQDDRLLPDGIDIEWASWITIEGFTITGMEGAGIRAVQTDNVIIRNNISDQNGQWGIFSDTSSNLLVVNNTVLAGAEGGGALGIQNGSSNATVLNNVLLTLSADQAAVDVSTDSLSGFVSDHNVVSSAFTLDGGSSVIDLATWQGATGQDGNSLVAAPGDVFVDFGAGDFHLRTGSPAIDAGTATNAPDVDLDGNPRPAGDGFDIGAYEGATAANSPPTAVDDQAETQLDLPVVVPVLANDSDADGDELFVTQVSQGANGSVVINDDGTVTYTPNAGFTGTDSFTYEVSDGNGGLASASVTVNVADAGVTVGLEDDPWNPGQSALVVRGTSASETVAFRYRPFRQQVAVFVNDQLSGVFDAAGFTRLLAFGGAGNDQLVLGPRVPKAAYFDGGDGDDRLVGGAADDVLLGGAGNDRLVGNLGRDILIGGTGADVLDSGPVFSFADDSDLLIAGTTSYDSDSAALQQIYQEWNSNRTYFRRVNNLRTGANGLPALNATTVQDDADRDVLRGGADLDWFFAQLGTDVLRDRFFLERVN